MLFLALVNRQAMQKFVNIPNFAIMASEHKS